MTTQFAPITHEHRELIGPLDEAVAIARELPRLTPAERAVRRDRVVAFLEGVLQPHAKAEERGLYQAVSRVLGHPEATAPMVYDHLAIREWTAELAAADPTDVDRLQELLYGIHALVLEHFRKEDELYLPLLARVGGDSSPDAYEAPTLHHEP